MSTLHTLEALKGRRSYYDLGKNLPVETDQILETIREITNLVPDAFNMKSQRVIVLLDEQHERFWNTVYDTFGGEVAREKIDGFAKAAGTILFYIDETIVDGLKEQFPIFRDQFTGWAIQSNGMLQINVWTALSELGLGASLQHYNPIIDDAVRETFGLEEGLMLMGQMVFGEKRSEPAVKPSEPSDARVTVFE